MILSIIGVAATDHVCSHPPVARLVFTVLMQQLSLFQSFSNTV